MPHPQPAVRLPPGELPDADAARRPPARLLLRESLTLVDLARANLARGFLRSLPDGDGHPVVVLPGFLAGPGSTLFLRAFLRSKGYFAYDWAQGQNVGVREGLSPRLIGRLEAICEARGEAVSIIGWSAGGIYARELARARPELVRGVITMGSPIRGNLHATAAWPAYAALNRGRHAADLSPDATRLREAPLDLPTTCIFSRRDGIVAWPLCTSLPAPRTENVETTSTHLAFGHDPGTLAVLADRLAQSPVQWRPYV